MSDVDGTTLELTETPDPYGAFPRLNEQQIQILESLGVRRRVGAEQVLVREGERNTNFIVVLDGLVQMVSDYGGEHRQVAVHGPGRFLGELGLIAGESSFVTNVMRTPGEVLEIPVQHLRQLVERDPALGELILRAFIVRRSMLIKLGAGLRIVGSRFTSETRRICEFATRNRLPFTFVDLEGDESAHRLLEAFGVPPDETPVVVWTDGRVLRKPTNADLARLIGLPFIESPQLVVDLVIVGAGPAGLAAAVYGASEGLSTIVLDASATGGQAATTSRIENYLGFPAGISGPELAERAIVQAEKFGADLSVPTKVVSLNERRGYHVVQTDGGTEFHARAVVIATGVHYRKLDVPRLMELEATCVFYAATYVEAEMCRNDPVVVVGGGNSAGQATMFLADQAAQVTLVVRESSLRENMSAYLADRIERNPKINLLLDSEIREFIGDRPLDAVVVENTASGDRRTVPAREIFVFIGADPHTRWLDGQLALDDRGYICTGPAAANGASANGTEDERLFLETSRPAVFAAGDVRSGSVKRIASAVGEGAMAVRLVHDRLTTRSYLAASEASIEKRSR
jgi:thioredoxin reductase (NADPH)